MDSWRLKSDICFSLLTPLFLSKALKNGATLVDDDKEGQNRSRTSSSSSSSSDSGSSSSGTFLLSNPYCSWLISSVCCI